MIHSLPVALRPVDHAILQLLVPLAVAILISGLDDLTIDLAWLLRWLHRILLPRADLFPPGERQLDSAPRRRIAILVPLWQEHRVIAHMLEHTIAVVRYPEYHIFAGAYPNDDRTQEAIRMWPRVLRTFTWRCVRTTGRLQKPTASTGFSSTC